MAKRLTTLVMRRCMRCRRTFELERWPWSGHGRAESHGLCPWCSVALMGELAAGGAPAPVPRPQPQPRGRIAR